MLLKILLPALFLIPGTALQAQKASRRPFGERLMLGFHYGYWEDYVGDCQTLFENEHFFGARAGVTVARQVYAGIQSRWIRAGNYETPAQSFYMAGVFARLIDALFAWVAPRQSNIKLLLQQSSLM
jgi:hypothetical protein